LKAFFAPTLHFDGDKVTVQDRRIQSAIIAKIWSLEKSENGANERDALDSKRKFLSVDFYIIIFHAVPEVANILLDCGPLREILLRLNKQGERIVLYWAALRHARVVHSVY